MMKVNFGSPPSHMMMRSKSTIFELLIPIARPRIQVAVRVSGTRYVHEIAAGSQAAVVCETKPNPAAGGPLTLRVRCRTLNPINSACTSTTPSFRSMRVPMRAHNRYKARLISRRWLLERCCERRGYVIGGGRLLLVLSRWRDL